MEQRGIEFREIKISSKDYGKPLKKVYFVIENGRSIVMESFYRLDQKTQRQIKALISKMATIPNYQSPQIRYALSGYTYGEIKPKPHRFFFFQMFGDALIFFDYVVKKKAVLDSKTYQQIQQKKERYEDAYQRDLPKRRRVF